MESSNEQQHIITTYRGMRNEIRRLAEKIGELDVDLHEHTRVLETLEPLNKDRKAYRMIGGVLVERTVEEIQPAVSKNKEEIMKIRTQLNDLLTKKEQEANAYQVCINN